MSSGENDMAGNGWLAIPRWHHRLDERRVRLIFTRVPLLLIQSNAARGCLSSCGYVAGPSHVTAEALKARRWVHLGNRLLPLIQHLPRGSWGDPM